MSGKTTATSGAGPQSLVARETTGKDFLKNIFKTFQGSFFTAPNAEAFLSVDEQRVRLDLEVVLQSRLVLQQQLRIVRSVFSFSCFFT